MIVVDNLEKFNVKATYIQGQKVAENGHSLILPVEEKTPNKFLAEEISEVDIRVDNQGKKIKVIESYDGELITGILEVSPKVMAGNVVSDVEKDVLKMVVLNRYEKAKPAVAFIKNIGLKSGAFASSVAHDSHNIVAVGTSDKAIAQAVNAIVRAKGGIVVINDGKEELLPLPVAGLMSNDDGYRVAARYEELDKMLHNMGATLRAPFMTLSFMALLVIPDLKLSDKGLFDGRTFNFTSLFV